MKIKKNNSEEKFNGMEMNSPNVLPLEMEQQRFIPKNNHSQDKSREVGDIGVKSRSAPAKTPEVIPHNNRAKEVLRASGKEPESKVIQVKKTKGEFGLDNSGYFQEKILKEVLKHKLFGECECVIDWLDYEEKEAVKSMIEEAISLTKKEILKMIDEWFNSLRIGAKESEKLNYRVIGVRDKESLKKQISEVKK